MSPIAELAAAADGLVHNDETGAPASVKSALGSSPNKLSSEDDSGSGGKSGSTSESKTSFEGSSSSGKGSGSAGADYEGKGPTPDSKSAVNADVHNETLQKINEVKTLVMSLQSVRTQIEAKSKEMSESKVLEKVTNEDLEIEKREIGTFHMSRDRSKSMEEYNDGTTIRRIDGSIERTLKDGTVEQISQTNEVTRKTAAGDVAVLAEHDTLLNQKLADGTQIQVCVCMLICQNVVQRNAMAIVEYPVQEMLTYLFFLVFIVA